MSTFLHTTASELYSPIAAEGNESLTRSSFWNETSLRRSGVTRQRSPEGTSHWRKSAGSTSSRKEYDPYSPADATRSAAVFMSVPTTLMRKEGNRMRNMMARVYASSPVEHAA